MQLPPVAAVPAARQAPRLLLPGCFLRALLRRQRLSLDQGRVGAGPVSAAGLAAVPQCSVCASQQGCLKGMSGQGGLHEGWDAVAHTSSVHSVTIFGVVQHIFLEPARSSRCCRSSGYPGCKLLHVLMDAVCVSAHLGTRDITHPGHGFSRPLVFPGPMFARPRSL